MKRSSRIQPLKNLASRHEQQAARALGRSRARLGQQETRLQELFAYREEYQQRFRREAANGIAGAQLQTYQAFMQQLDEAIRQQRLQVEQAAQSCQSVTARWQETHVRTQVLDKALERLRAGEQRQAEKASQREVEDIFAARRSGILHRI